jgi:hypothetical protein
MTLQSPRLLRVSSVAKICGVTNPHRALLGRVGPLAGRKQGQKVGSFLVPSEKTRPYVSM